EKIARWMIKEGFASWKTTYHLRDWLISRQRYWGPPIPMIYCLTCAAKGECWFSREKHACPANWNSTGWYPEENLPVELPIIKDYKPEGKGKGPLANHPEFYKTKCPYCGGDATRETDVSDTFVDSSWYFLRYPSIGIESSKYEVRNTKQIQNSKVQNSKPFEFRISNFELPWNLEVTRRWLPVDLYFGGAEHAVLHLMYARFVTMALYDLKLIHFDEPFPRFYAHGLMIKDGAKMSKSRGNVVNPDEYIAKFGADTLRLYLMFMGPMDGYPDFRDTGIEGMYRFIKRVWNLFSEYQDIVLTQEKDSKEVLVKMHQTIKKVTNDIENFRYNVSLAAIMEYVNVLYEKTKNSGTRSSAAGVRSSQYHIRCAEWDEALRTLCLLLAPLAPHMTEEIWQRYYKNPKSEIRNPKFYSVHFQPWPKYVEELTKVARVIVPVQIDGKLRATLDLESEKSNSQEQVEELARGDAKVSKLLGGRAIKDVVFVPGRLINFVTKNPA
ncbi:MAG: class I tRNA ligase family protein, partial [Patescibacteria group bacterium]